MRAIVVDDEEPARERLRRLLAETGGVEVVAEAADGGDAISRIVEHGPDVVFLDIQMPGCSGIEVAASLPSPRPHIVFCTAFDQYAVDAFELNAVDYLLKPVTRARLAQALERVRRGPGERPPGEGLDRAAAAMAPARFLARRGTAFRVVPAREVLCFLSVDGDTRVHTGRGDFSMPLTLNDLEARLDPRQFFRVSRAAIVNLDAVREVAPLMGGYGEAALTDGTRLEVSRRRYKDLTERLAAF